MIRLRVLLVIVSFCVAAAPAITATLDQRELTFERAGPGTTLPGWGGGPPQTIARDTTVVHAGEGAARLQRTARSPGEFTTITRILPVDFTGAMIEFRGFLRTEGVTGEATLWMRQDGADGMLTFINMRNRALTGDNPWAQHRIALPLHEDARELVFGVLVNGAGTVWADDLQLLVDGRPFQDVAPPTPPTVLDQDQEFDDGSGLDLDDLTRDQVEHVALLGRVWGFLKYHHPRVTGGESHWDYELFRVLPDVLAAPDRAACRRVLTAWVDRLGTPEPCDPCAPAPSDVQLAPPLAWLDDDELLGADLARRLREVHAGRHAGGPQFYVDLMPGARNPEFTHELTYGEGFPDAGQRILAVLRFWNVIQYWFPYRDLIDDPWPDVLHEFLPRLVRARDRHAYVLELMALAARVRDTHCNLWGELARRPPRGDAHWPVHLRMIEGRPTVTAYTDPERGPASGLAIGDVILAIAGRPVAELIAEWAPYYCASNQAARLRDIAWTMPRGPAGPTPVTVERDGERRDLVIERIVEADRPWPAHDRPGEAFQLLSPEIAYLKLSGVASADVPSYLERAEGTRGMVIDIRNYPAEFVVFTLAPHFVDEPTPFARFAKADLANPGAFAWSDETVLTPLEPGYRGGVAILVDEVSISQAEYTAMALRCGPRAVVVGSTTAGADGNISFVDLPGQVRAAISGIGIFYPDGTPTQRVGIVPDIEARPTIAGWKAGRDEVLEAAVRHLLGPEAEEAAIRGMCRRLD